MKVVIVIRIEAEIGDDVTSLANLRGEHKNIAAEMYDLMYPFGAEVKNVDVTSAPPNSDVGIP